MRRLSILLPVVAMIVASCARQEQIPVRERAMKQEKKKVQENVPSLTPPKALEDEWSRGLIGEWDILAESDLRVEVVGGRAGDFGSH